MTGYWPINYWSAFWPTDYWPDRIIIVLSVDEATHAHSADGPVLIQAHVLVVNDATHSHTADNLSFPTMGVIIDPTIVSVTVQRSMQSVTVQRLIVSI